MGLLKKKEPTPLEQELSRIDELIIATNPLSEDYQSLLLTRKEIQSQISMANKKDRISKDVLLMAGITTGIHVTNWILDTRGHVKTRGFHTDTPTPNIWGPRKKGGDTK